MFICSGSQQQIEAMLFELKKERRFDECRLTCTRSTEEDYYGHQSEFYHLKLSAPMDRDWETLLTP